MSFFGNEARRHPTSSLLCNHECMPVQIIRNEAPQEIQATLAAAIASAIGARKGLWEIDTTSSPDANAWDIEVIGPHNFYWARRFSAEDRDADVIAEAIRAAVVHQAA
jgi:hypothetical protein